MHRKFEVTAQHKRYLLVLGFHSQEADALDGHKIGGFVKAIVSKATLYELASEVIFRIKFAKGPSKI